MDDPGQFLGSPGRKLDFECSTPLVGRARASTP